MTTRIVLSLTLVLALAACGSRMNPMTWFGPSREEPTIAVQPERVTVEERVLIDRITALKIEPAGNGAILRITAQSDTPGAYDVTFVGLNDGLPDDKGTLTFEMRVMHPTPPQPSGLRTILAAHFVGNFALDRTRRIVVKGATNQRSINR